MTLPYRDAPNAGAVLRARLGHRLDAAGETADWESLVLHDPRPSSDARGHVWWEYTAVVGCRTGPGGATVPQV